MLCENCFIEKSIICRPKNHMKVCKKCFFELFETEVHETIIKNNLFQKDEKILLAVSGGKDSTVLAYVVDLLNKKYKYGVTLHMVCIDEGIKGYRDYSLKTVKENQKDYGLDLEIVSFKEMFGVTMDEVMNDRNKSSCTYCGVFRRQALEEGAKRIGSTKIVTGHNADDMAETVLLNLLRGDYKRLIRCTSAITKRQKSIQNYSSTKMNNNIDIEDTAKGCSCQMQSEFESSLQRLKPFKHIYEKEIVFYAYLKNLKYFATECKYSYGAHREYARMFLRTLDTRLIKNIIKSGEYFQKNEMILNVKKCSICKKQISAHQKVCKSCSLLQSLQNIHIHEENVLSTK